MMNIASFIYKTRLNNIIDFLDYVVVLRLMCSLPVRTAERLAALRGHLRYFFDLDWRSSCLGYPFVREKTLRAFSSFIDPSSIDKKVQGRFVHQSLEELEAMLFSRHGKNWPREVIYENIEPLKIIQEEGKGIILLTAHFDSSVAGSVFLGDLGVNVNIYYDEIVYDSRVPCYFQNFFRKKYSAIKSHYNDGDFISRKNLKGLHRRLKQGEVFIWLYDVLLNLPGRINVRFLGKNYRAPDNALRIALSTGSYIGAYVTIREGDGNYRTVFSKPVLPSELDDPGDAIREACSFLSGWILKSPERWWAADTLCDYPEI